MINCKRFNFVADMLGITDAERPILIKTLEDKPNKTIASELGITEKAVENRKTRIFKKIGGKENLKKITE